MSKEEILMRISWLTSNEPGHEPNIYEIIEIIQAIAEKLPKDRRPK